MSENERAFDREMKNWRCANGQENGSKNTKRREWHIKEFKEDGVEERNWNAEQRMLQRKMLKTR